MLRYATRELERRRRLPHRVLHAYLMRSQTFGRSLPHGWCRHAATSQTAAAARYDGSQQSPTGDSRDANRFSSPRIDGWGASRTGRQGQWHLASQYGRAPATRAESAHEEKDELRADHYETYPDQPIANLPRAAQDKAAKGARSTFSSRTRPAEGGARMEQSLAHMTPSTLLRKVLGGVADAHYWRTEVSKARSLRLPIVLLQMLIRKEEDRLRNGSALLELLPSDREWDRIVDLVSRTGHTRKDLDDYLHILEGRTDDERCERLLERDAPGPMFLFTFLLRPSSNITKVATLDALIGYCNRYYDGTKKRTGSTEIHLGAGVSDESLDLGQDKFGLVMRLLTRHCLRLEPRLIVKLANVAARYIEKITTYPDEPRKLFLIQCEVFNRAMRMFRPQPEVQSIQRLLPNAYFWEAQRTLLAMSASLNKPLLVDGEGFRAIRDVLAGQAKNHTEVHSSARHAATWPPYLQPSDGMDERADPEDNWSRTVSAGMLMQEAGFAKEEQDEALDILQGMTTDGTPTIQQRALMGKGRHVGVWEASIRATRNAQEAWERFQNPPKPGSKPGTAQYAAMFEKLVLREADSSSRILPGDKALNFPTHQEANLAEFERARLRPPSVAQLYQHMRLNGVRPQDSCLRILVANAESLDTAHRYLRDSTAKGRVVCSLLADEPDPQLLKVVPMSLFAAYMQTCSRMEGRRGGRQLMRAIRLAGLRLDRERSRWAPYVWGLLLKNLSQHRRALRVSLSEQVDMFLQVMEKIEKSHGIRLSTFIQFTKCIRKATRRELARLVTDLESAESAKHNSLRLLYDAQTASSTAAEEQCHSPGAAGSQSSGPEAGAPFSLLKIAAGHMRGLFSRLVEQERESQGISHVDNIAPLDRMACRTDPVRSEHAYEYMLSLAFVGEFDEMARTLQWLMEEWAQPDVVHAMKELDEPPPYADFFDTLCAFRLLAEPMLEAAVVGSLRQAVAGPRPGWTWPDDEAVAAHAEMQGDESIATLARVLDWTRYWQRTDRGGEV
ncbi:Uncharacterized protein TCAP_00286 [Tolypocladium capitatum]|uniref:Uncharacterized protein n=1 Tax=Tolypocladium capitatum TaxID=45235 RepID=A0A2K3QQK8_9HYPO|nr:Uncharacterized protein TCAP_00286 [Tolypocladium capitatum]